MNKTKEQLHLYKFKEVDISERELESSNSGDINISRSDCLDMLSNMPDGFVDVIVTDPAYSGMNNKLKLGNGRIVGEYKDKDTEAGKWFSEFEDTEDNYRSFLSECRRVLSDDGHVYIMFDSFSLLTLGPLIREYFDVKNIIVWDKVNIGMGHYYRRRHEFIIFATNGNNRKLVNQKFPDVWRFKRIYKAPYSTQKPVEVFEAMIYASAKEGAVVCDPFLGSGSSAIASVINGCSFWGCDVSEEAVGLAKERVRIFRKTGVDPLQKKPAHIEGEKIFWRK
jgi:site-specific DNA-methyltransferase (adenine-specific)